jgi:hypothetical protein
MDLLERYLQAVGQHLPQETREDVLAELRVNLLAEMDARAEEMERPLTESETAAILKAHGRPMLVAARYLPQRYLIGPAVFPFYLLTLRKAAPLVVLIYFVARGARPSFSKNAGGFAANIATQLRAACASAAAFLGRGDHDVRDPGICPKQYGQCANWNAWDPAKLPPLTRIQRRRSRWPAELQTWWCTVFGCCMCLRFRATLI